MAFIKHKDNRDVAFEIIEDRTVHNSDEVVLFGLWWNIAFPEPFPIAQSKYGMIRACKEVITIPIKDYSDWEEFQSVLETRDAVKATKFISKHSD